MITDDSRSGDDAKTLKYRAPALEKGLDVLELLAANKRPMTLSQISNRLDRSVSELFRMVQVLESRGYVAPSQKGEGLELTNKLFSLGMSRGPSQNLLASALPLMQALSEQVRQSVHLAIASDDHMVVIARIEAPGDLGFSVRVGYQRLLVQSTSGLVLYAFQPPKLKEHWRSVLKGTATPQEWALFETVSERALQQGHVQAKSDFVDGVLDVSCPVLNDSSVIAAMTIPWLKTHGCLSLEDTIAKLKSTAGALTKMLGG
ncbi:IclR family transcriptional regulator [Asticcacaulis sp. YBE204]|uniref:IclR family transcriptional regulator n=1 Tax=Asticcacaulis sp. YBE204 TaxID=1282363 RepID=UPI0003C3DD71|nr:IclR family transcriptional regulator [Asticcacaulis sp. YBE204]ESQ79727.1 IclR family transcriptional regulator [Asticcacaulis sp. YBE204]